MKGPPAPRFAGSDSYVATGELTLAVNAAVTLSRPLLVKGEPGTGKTQLAEKGTLPFSSSEKGTLPFS